MNQQLELILYYVKSKLYTFCFGVFFKFLFYSSIWDYLVDITRGGQKTVIITTHYIDETRQAHLIGLMRGGRFLAEESPTDLLRQYNSESLEDVFLKLAVIQNMGKRRRSSIATEVIEQMRVTTAMSVSTILYLTILYVT